jgi:hypothetical protein
MPGGNVFLGQPAVTQGLKGSELIERMEPNPLVVFRKRVILGNAVFANDAGNGCVFAIAKFAIVFAGTLVGGWATVILLKGVAADSGRDEGALAPQPATHSGSAFDPKRASGTIAISWIQRYD